MKNANDLRRIAAEVRDVRPGAAGELARIANLLDRDAAGEQTTTAAYLHQIEAADERIEKLETALKECLKALKQAVECITAASGQ